MVRLARIELAASCSAVKRLSPVGDRVFAVALKWSIAPNGGG
jgi:hypothetical protein